MKAKILSVLFFAFIGVSAQRTGFSLEPYMGFGTSESVQNGANNLGGNIGCGLVYMFNKHWGISSGLQVQRYSTDVNSNEDSVNLTAGRAADGSEWSITKGTTTYNFTYLELPVVARYISSSDNKTGFFAEAGVVAGYLISGNESGTINPTLDSYSMYPIGTGSYSSTILSTTSFTGINPEYHPFNLTGYLALGVIFPLNQRVSLITDVSVNKGFTNVGNSLNDMVTVNDAAFYLYNKNSSGSPVSNYGTNFSGLLSVRLNIKLGALPAMQQEVKNL